MAVIYDFAAYHSSHLLNVFARQTGEVACLLSAQERQLHRLEESVARIGEAMRGFDRTLGDCRARLDEALEHGRSRQSATDSGDIEQMIAARDHILSDTKKRRRAH